MNQDIAIDLLWILICAILVLMMQAGFLCIEAGATRNKNNINTALKNICDFGICMLVFWACGYGLMFGVSAFGLTGMSEFFFISRSANEGAWFIYQAAFCGAAITIVSGAVAERLKFSMYLLIAVVGALLVYPLIGHWVWNENGWLATLGFIDFAGSTVVHGLGGTIALACVIILGPRTGRFRDDGTVREFNGSNVPLSLLGTLLLFFGWFGFNGGSAGAFNESVPLILINTLLGGAAGLVTTIVLCYVIHRRPLVLKIMNGLLGGLVSITASCHSVTAFEAILIGSMGGFVVLSAEYLLERFYLDDAVGAIPVHLACGIWGTLAVGLFGDADILGTGLNGDQQIAIQLFGVVACFTTVFIISFLFILGADQLWGIRVSRAAEEAGLNVAEHRANDDVEELLTVMQEQANSRDLTLRAPQEPFTQAGQIGVHYNNLVWSLEGSAQETESVLKRVLPEGVAERLKQGSEIHDTYEEVSVIFIDLVGFTNLANTLVARRVVSLLNDIFGRFDKRAAAHNVEKIKTIGDSYMAVSGLRKDSPDHAENAVRMALATIEEINDFNRANKFDLNVRVGVHSGPVIGGVIGESRFMYDMWGDTVNVASRMEAGGISGNVQISETTYDLVKLVPDFSCMPRGGVQVKGKGEMNTWLLDLTGNA
jgi:Amt family ammonium transporter